MADNVAWEFIGINKSRGSASYSFWAARQWFEQPHVHNWPEERRVWSLQNRWLLSSILDQHWFNNPVRFQPAWAETLSRLRQESPGGFICLKYAIDLFELHGALGPCQVNASQILPPFPLYTEQLPCYNVLYYLASVCVCLSTIRIDFKAGRMPLSIYWGAGIQ